MTKECVGRGTLSALELIEGKLVSYLTSAEMLANKSASLLTKAGKIVLMASANDYLIH